jgi:biotin synthase-related radical SAM superfamily protein
MNLFPALPMPDYLIPTRSQPRQSSNRPSFLARARARVSTPDSKPMWKRFVNNSLPLQNPVQQKHQKKEGDDMLLAETSSPSLYVNSFVTLRPKEIDV